MSRIYDSNDLFFSYDADLAVGADGDLQDTSFDPLRSITQEILTRVRSDKGEWKYQPNIGSDVSRFAGQPNTAEIGRQIKNSIINSLLVHALINQEDLQVQVVPIAVDMIAVRIVLRYVQTLNNSNSLPVTLNFLYSYSDDRVYPMNNRYSIQ